jgi:hypothetical protein
MTLCAANVTGGIRQKIINAYRVHFGAAGDNWSKP